MCKHSGPLSTTANRHENRSELEIVAPDALVLPLLAARYRGERHDCKKTLKGGGRANSPDLCQIPRESRGPRPCSEVVGVVSLIGFYRKEGKLSSE